MKDKHEQLFSHRENDVYRDHFISSYSPITEKLVYQRGTGNQRNQAFLSIYFPVSFFDREMGVF